MKTYKTKNNASKSGYGSMNGSIKGHNKGHPNYDVNGMAGRPKKWNEEKIEELAESLDKWIADAVERRDQFWWWDWCFDVGLDQSKVSNIARENERFRKSYEKAKQWQEAVILKHSLTKKLSEGMSKFFLVNQYSDRWKEKQSDEKDKAPPLDAIVETQNENILLKAQLKKLQDQIDNLTQTRS